MTRKDQYTEELVMTIMRLFDKNKNDPSIDEICSAHFGDMFLPGDILVSVKQRLPRIKAMLEDLGYNVYFVNRKYYMTLRSVEPTTDEEAIERLPIGGGSNTEKAHRHGIKRCLDPEHDLMWQATITNNLETANGKSTKNVERIHTAVRSLGLSHDTAEKLLGSDAL